MKINNKIQIVFLLCCTALFSQIKDGRLSGLDKEIEHLMEKAKVVGLSIAIVENDKVVYKKGFGYRDLENRLPVTESTVFPVGSITKQFTASLIGVLEGEKQLSVYDSPRKYIPNLSFNSDEMNNLVTIEDLLSHRSGIGNVDGTHVLFPTNNIDRHLERLSYLIPNSNVRERFDYSNMGYAILGKISENLMNDTWHENINNRIFAPLKMNESSTSIRSLLESPNYAVGYGIKDNEVVKVSYENQFESAASGAINSSINDMVKWMKLLLNEGVGNEGQQLLPKKFLENSFSEHTLIRKSFNAEKKFNLLFDTYGYGWFVHTYKNFYRVNHGGNVSGFTASIDLYPYKEVGIVVLTNQGGTNVNRILVDIITSRMLKLKRKHCDTYPIRVAQSIIVCEKREGLNKSKKPSHLLKDYTGVYQNKGYGTLKIKIENNELIAEFPKFQLCLEHQFYNSFIGKKIEQIHQNIPPLNFSFIVNSQGNISSLIINLQEAPVEFIKNI